MFSRCVCAAGSVMLLPQLVVNGTGMAVRCSSWMCCRRPLGALVVAVSAAPSCFHFELSTGWGHGLPQNTPC